MTAVATEFHVADVSKLAWNAETADTVAEATGGKAAFIEPKYDGIRLLAHVTESGVNLYTRNGNNKAGYLAHVEAELAERFPVGTWLDGEAVGFEFAEAEGVEETTDHLLHVIHNWGTAQSVLGGNPKPASQQDKITYVVFDLVAHGGIDARALPFSQRRGLLESCFDSIPEGGPVILSPAEEATEEAHEAHLAAGFEGSMVKLAAARYASGKRGSGLAKLKPQQTDEAIVIGFKEGEGGFAGMIGALIVGQHNATGELVEVTRFSGFDIPLRKHISDHRDEYLGRVVEFKSHGLMPSGGYRHPQFLRFRDDKGADECVVAEPKAKAEKPAKTAEKPAKATPAYDPATALMTGRSGSGKLRNFKAMSDEKFAGVLVAVLTEGNDPEAIAAVEAEQNRRTS